MKGIVTATCISEKKGTRKHPVNSITLLENCGIIGDAHAVNADTHTHTHTPMCFPSHLFISQS